MAIRRSTLFLGVAVLICVMLATNCAIAQEPFFGKWHEIGDKSETVEFFADGKFNYVENGFSAGGTWTTLDDNRIRVEMLVHGTKIMGTGHIESNVLVLGKTRFVRANSKDSPGPERSEAAEKRYDQRLGAVKKSGTETDPDVSISGQIAYACALANHVTTHYGPAQTWKRGLGNGARATIEASAVAALLGATAGASHRLGFADISGIGQEIVTGVMRLDMDRLQQGLDQFAVYCATGELASSGTADAGIVESIKDNADAVRANQEGAGARQDELFKKFSTRAIKVGKNAANLLKAVPEHCPLKVANPTIRTTRGYDVACKSGHWYMTYLPLGNPPQLIRYRHLPVCSSISSERALYYNFGAVLIFRGVAQKYMNIENRNELIDHELWDKLFELSHVQFNNEKWFPYIYHECTTEDM